MRYCMNSLSLQFFDRQKANDLLDREKKKRDEESDAADEQTSDEPAPAKTTNGSGAVKSRE
jgi:hypothetical protein